MFWNKKKKILQKNNELLVQRNNDLYQRGIRYQKENRKLREQVAKLRLELEDTKGFLQQEKVAKQKLLLEREKRNDR